MLEPRITTVVLLIVMCLRQIQAYCWEPGKNPGFTGPPVVEQVNISFVRVSWEGLVTYRSCADQFLVKYWQKSSPQDYVMTDLLENTANSVIIKVTPKAEYQFQAVAREDKGTIGGVDWNKSPLTDFKTSSHNTHIVIEPTIVSQSSKGVEPSNSVNQNAPTAVYEKQPNENSLPLSIELLAILVVIGIGVILIFVGVIYKFFCAKKVDLDEESCSEEDNDEDDEEHEKLSVTDSR